MGIVIKQSAYASLVNYIGVILGAINIIFLFPIVFSQAELGLFKAMMAMSIILSPFAQLGLARSTLRFFSRFSASNKTQGRFLALVLILGVATFAFFLLLFFLLDNWFFSFYVEKAPELIDQYWLIVSLAFLLMYIAIIESYYKALLNVIIPTFMREVFIRLATSILAFLFFLNYIDFSLFLKLSVASYAVSLLILILILFLKKQFHLNFSIFRIQKSFFKEMLKYMVFVMAGAVGTVIILQIDQLMVTSYLGLASNGVYVVAFFMASVVDIPRRAIAQMSDSVIAKSFEMERIDEVKKIYKQSSINQLILGCFVFLGIVLNLDNIYEIMPKGDEFKIGATVVVIIGFSKLIDMGFGVNSEIIISSKLYKANIYFVIVLALLTISLNALLIPQLGLNGAAYASLCAVLIFNLLKMFFIWKYIKVQPFSKNTLVVLFYALAIFIFVNLLPTFQNVYLNTIYISLVVSILFLAFTLLFKPSKEIQSILNNILIKFKKQ